MKFFKKIIQHKNKEKSTYNNANTKLSNSLESNILLFKKIFECDDTVMYRDMKLKNSGVKFCLIFLRSMVDMDLLSRDVIQPILNDGFDEISEKRRIDYIKNNIISYSSAEKTTDLDTIIHSVLYGSALILSDNCSEALIVDVSGFKSRNISEPTVESVIRGPREGFVEQLFINTSLIRRRILNSDLKFKFKVMGKTTKTKICICYLKGLANPKILDELNKRLDSIDIDGILDSGYIQELIKDEPFSPFKTIGATERPDRVAGNILEGRIAVIVDGSPYVLTLPYLFMENFQVSEDYYTGFVYASINRMLRWMAFFISTSVPAVYIALVTFHQEMVPTPLILSISAAREGVPFPTILEAILMLLIFEILREAGARLPSPIGSTIGFVGAVILGEAAITAKFVSAPIVIVAALTGISNFLLPTMLGALNLIRFIFILLSSVMGLYGYIFGVIGLFIHMMSMRTFGLPYMLNIGSISGQEIKDTVIRAPWLLMQLRPKLIGKSNMVRKR